MSTNIIDTDSAFLQPLDYDNLTSAEQLYVQALISAATEIIEKYLNRPVVEQTVTEYISGDNDESILLKYIPINELTSVTYISSVDGTEDLVDDAEFQYNEKGELRWNAWSNSSSVNRGSWPRGFRNVKVIYKAGWPLISVPIPLQKVTADLVMGMYDPSQSNENLEKEKLGEYFYQVKKDAVSAVLTSSQGILGLYRLRR